MAFKVVFHAPDADPEKNRCVVETSKCKLFVVEVKSRGNVGVFVARGDGPSNRASSKARQRGGYRGRQTN